jgi:hypothetical protein
MSDREMLKRDIDFMPDDVIAVFTTYWVDKKHEIETPNEDTVQACEDAINGRYEKSFDNAEDLISYIHSLGDEDEEL